MAPFDSAGGPPVIPDGLAERVRREGQEGWLNELADLIVELAERWGLQLGTPFSRGPTVSWVAPAGKVDGVRAVLKVGMPHREARTEAAGLRFFAGQGAVRLLRADEEVFALVEERCEPGNELWDLPVDEGNQVATEVLRRLWRRADGTGPIERLSDLAKEWGAGIPGLGRNYPPDLAELGIDLADELGSSQPDLVVLHGDFNPGNILKSQRGWLSIDCKPLVGEPAFELGQLLVNRLGIDLAWEPEDPDSWPFAPSIALGELARQSRLLRRHPWNRTRSCHWLDGCQSPGLGLGPGNHPSVCELALTNSIDRADVRRFGDTLGFIFGTQCADRDAPRTGARNTSRP